MNNEFQGIGMTSQRARDRLVLQLQKMGVHSDNVLDVIRNTPRHIFVDEALASYKAQLDGSATAVAAATGSAVASGFGIDWGDVPAREITIFYPGETSMVRQSSNLQGRSQVLNLRTKLPSNTLPHQL